MNLSPDNGNIDQAIAELEKAIRVAAVQNVMERWAEPPGELRIRLESLRALELAGA